MVDACCRLASTGMLIFLSIQSSRGNTFHHPRTSGSTTAVTNFGCCLRATMTSNIGAATLTCLMTVHTTFESFRIDRDVGSNSPDRLTPTLESNFHAPFPWTQPRPIELFARP